MRLFVTLLCLLFAFPVSAERLALVLGNSGYHHTAPLPNAANDARDMAAKLRDMGFDVYEGIDLTREDTLRLVQKFSRAVRQDDTALFYFAGHGMQLGSDNYVLPVDARPGSQADLTQSAVRLQSVLRTLENSADTRIIILDACRNNPFQASGSSRSSGENRGLMKMEAGVGSFIAFSTEPGNVAADGSGRNSPFTSALLKHIDEPGADIHRVMRNVRGDVMNVSNQTQIPWENSALLSEVFLTPQKVAAKPAQSSTRVPATRVPQQADPLANFRHYVGGLDPYGDGFLALRTSPSSKGALLAKMPSDTPLQVINQSGKWNQVIVPNGMTGWAHSRWIYCCRAGTGAAAQAASGLPSSPSGTSLTTPGLPSSPKGTSLATPTSCEDLWYARNLIFARRGYCFKSARGQAAFGHMDCIPGLAAGDVPLSASEKDEVNYIRSLERQNGC